MLVARAVHDTRTGRVAWALYGDPVLSLA